MKARFLKYWVIVVAAITLSFGVQLLLLSENAHMSYKLADLKRREAALRDQRNVLALEAATLRQVDRVEAIARGSFGMEVPKSSHVIVMGRTQEQHASGSAR
jgi:cell division protein FtsL